MTRRKIIADGGDSFLEAVRNTQNDIEIRPSREKCLFVIADKDFKSYSSRNLFLSSTVIKYIL